MTPNHLAAPGILHPRTSLAALLAAGAGALAVLAFPPFGLSPAMVVALAVLLGLLVGRRPGEGLLIGWAFVIGLLGFGVFWIRISLDDFGYMATGLARALTLVFRLAVALCQVRPACLSGWASGSLRRKPWRRPWKRCIPRRASRAP